MAIYLANTASCTREIDWKLIPSFRLNDYAALFHRMGSALEAKIVENMVEYIPLLGQVPFRCGIINRVNEIFVSNTRTNETLSTLSPHVWSHLARDLGNNLICNATACQQQDTDFMRAARLMSVNGCAFRYEKIWNNLDVEQNDNNVQIVAFNWGDSIIDFDLGNYGIMAQQRVEPFNATSLSIHSAIHVELKNVQWLSVSPEDNPQFYREGEKNILINDIFTDLNRLEGADVVLCNERFFSFVMQAKKGALERVIVKKHPLSSSAKHHKAICINPNIPIQTEPNLNRWLCKLAGEPLPPQGKSF